MANDSERKIPNTIALTERQTQAITREAKRIGISFSDQARRIFDDWIDRKPGLAGKLYEGRTSGG